MRVEYHPEALAEFREAAIYYESRQRGLGGRFIGAVESSVVNRSVPLCYITRVAWRWSLPQYSYRPPRLQPCAAAARRNPTACGAGA
jgi:hypothetical protein